LQGKRVVITGSSRGLGRAVAIEMAKAGAQVVVNGTNAEALAETAALIAKAGGEAVGVVGSVAEVFPAIAAGAAPADSKWYETR
jgi:3-oxoacyl-[acyl-carrier protein] reductase